MSQLVQRLERRELMARIRDPEDGRAPLIAITDAGRTLVADRLRDRHDCSAGRLATCPPGVRTASALPRFAGHFAAIMLSNEMLDESDLSGLYPPDLVDLVPVARRLVRDRRRRLRQRPAARADHHHRVRRRTGRPRRPRDRRGRVLLASDAAHGHSPRSTVTGAT